MVPILVAYIILEMCPGKADVYYGPFVTYEQAREVSSREAALRSYAPRDVFPINPRCQMVIRELKSLNGTPQLQLRQPPLAD